MAKHLIFTVALALIGLATHTMESAPDKATASVSEEAKARFVKKCFRDRTKKSCRAGLPVET